MNMSQPYAPVAKKPSGNLACVKNSVASRIRAVIVSLYWAHFWAPHFKRDIEGLEPVQQKETRLLKGVKNLSHEGQLRELGLFSLK